MGRPKGLLLLQGETFVARAVQSLVDGGCDPIVVIVAEGDDAMASEAATTGATVLRNPDPGEGPITSLRLALAHLADSVAGIAYLPVDHPAVSPATVRLLLEEAAESDAPLVVPMRGPKRGHPAIFRSSIFPELIDPALQGGARTVVHRHLNDARLVDVDDPGVTADIDTPESYESLVEGRS